MNWGFHITLKNLDRLLRWVRWPIQLSLPGANQSHTLWVICGLVLLVLASPWILDYALVFWHRQKPLSTRQLQANSPGALRLLRQVCRQQGWQLPELRVIPDPAPLCFSYGWLPRNTRIVVSQGLLDQFSDQGLTALYGYELARMVNSSLPVLSAVALPLLVLHSSYGWLAQVGDAITQPLVRTILGLLASALYGLFWLLRQIVLWLSRLCCSWGDRRAVALTQHPDRLAEALLGLAGAIATHLRQRGQLHPLHTSLEVLMPIGFRQALSPGSLLASSEGDATVTAALMATDGLNPYRQWLRVSASHLPLGERLLWLNQQALLRGQPGIFPEQQPLLTQVSLPLLLLQKSPLTGLIAGGGLAMGLWFLGGIVNRLGWQRLSWLYQDPSILVGGLWLGLGLGLLLRINLLFPDAVGPSVSSLKGTATPAAPNTVAALLQHPNPLPVQGQPVTLRGNLRGRSGVGNWGCQDLYLDDASGLIRLANPMPLGSLQGVIQPRNHPFSWIGRRVTVTGWGRYNGGMLWVDINQIQLDQQRFFQAYGPIWATATSLGVSLIGIATILRGG
jgi:Zn-dependent protease with chaperone function